MLKNMLFLMDTPSVKKPPKTYAETPPNIYIFTDRFNGMIHYIELSIGRPRHQHIATSNIKIGYTLGRKEGHFILEGTTQNDLASDFCR